MSSKSIASSLIPCVTSVIEALDRRALLSVSPTTLTPLAVSDSSGEFLAPAAIQHPSVTGVRRERAHNVSRDDFVAADVMLPNPGAGIDPTTLTSSTVTLTAHK